MMSLHANTPYTCIREYVELKTVGSLREAAAQSIISSPSPYPLLHGEDVGDWWEVLDVRHRKVQTINDIRGRQGKSLTQTT